MSAALVVGITGNMGAGKSRVARMLRGAGLPVYDSDSSSKALLDTDTQLKEELKAAFGDDLYDEAGRLRRPLLAERAFPTPETTARLNAIVHPAVKRDFVRWREERENEGKHLLFKEAALIYEAGTDAELDAVWLVAAPLEKRIKRVMRRDGLSREQIEARMARQWPEERKRELASFVIENYGKQTIAPQIRRALSALDSACTARQS